MFCCKQPNIHPIYSIRTHIYIICRAGRKRLVKRREAAMVAGMQKLTLLDFPGHVACTLFTWGCNLRCPFCHNSPLVTAPLGQGLDEAAVMAFLQKRKGVLDGVAITGGEPLIGDDIFRFIEQIRSLGYAVKLDTNGFYPKRLEKLLAAGLVDYVAMDIKAAPKNYPLVTGISDINTAPVTQSINMLMGSGTEYEFRTTFVKGLHTADDALDIGRMIKGAKHYYLQCYKDSGMVINPKGLGSFTYDEMAGFLAAVKDNIPAAAIRGIEQ